MITLLPPKMAIPKDFEYKIERRGSPILVMLNLMSLDIENIQSILINIFFLQEQVFFLFGLNFHFVFFFSLKIYVRDNVRILHETYVIHEIKFEKRLKEFEKPKLIIY